MDAGPPGSPAADASPRTDSSTSPVDACVAQRAHFAFDIERVDGKTFHLEAAAKQSVEEGRMLLLAKFVDDSPLGITFAIGINYPIANVVANTPYTASPPDSDVVVYVVHAADLEPNGTANIGFAKGGPIIFSRITATECDPISGTFEGLEYESTSSEFPLGKIRLSGGTFRSDTL